LEARSLMSKAKDADNLPDEEAARRRDEALRRALSMPPKPRGAKEEESPPPPKGRTPSGSGRAGKRGPRTGGRTA